MSFDFKKEFKELYLPKNKPEIVQIPEMKFLAVRGMGDPNVEGGDYQTALGLLYAVAYTLKMSYKTEYKIEGFFEYVVPPLEGFWSVNGINGVDCTMVLMMMSPLLLNLCTNILKKMDMHWIFQRNGCITKYIFLIQGKLYQRKIGV